jgi:acyl-CoA thioesterase-1
MSGRLSRRRGIARVAAFEQGKQVEKMKLRPILRGLLAAFSLFALELNATAADTGETVIVVLGDSLTAGYGLPQDLSFPAQLEAALKARGQNVRVVNAGVSGDTAAAGLKRLEWAVPEDADAVIVELGANDALQGLPPAETKKALTKIIETIQAKGLPVLLAGMEAPRNMGQEYVDAFAAMYVDLAAEHDVILYPFFLDGPALNDDLMLKDGIHPNGAGVAAIIENILPNVEELLAQARN